jgi:hypothetical protein
MKRKPWIYNEPDEKWIQEAAWKRNKARRIGGRVEKATKGVVRTNSTLLKGADIPEPLLVICIKIINERDKKDINAFRDLIQKERIAFTYVCRMGEDLEGTYERYKESIDRIKKLANELLDEISTGKRH